MRINYKKNIDKRKFNGSGTRNSSGQFEKQDDVKRFWSKVDKTNKCWTWMREITLDGYGRFTLSYGGAEHAHRFSYRLTYGDFPKHLYILHRCDNPSCVRPDHLFIGTQKDNVADMIRKGRFRTARGTERKNSKLTEENIKLIAKLYLDGARNVTLSKMFNVGSGQISFILHGKRWKHVSRPIFNKRERTICGYIGS